MPSSDSFWTRGGPSPAAPTWEPRKTPCSGPWRRTLNPTAREFSCDIYPAARSGTSPGAWSYSSSASTSTSSLASTFSAISLSSSPSSSPERQASPPARPDVIPGFIYRTEIFRAQANASSLLQQQPHVNDQVGRHPTMVWDVYEREDGEKIARCLQMTSFGKHTIEWKYPGAWKYHCQYLPVKQRETTSRTNQPLLQLQEGMKMASQTYVHLDHFFEIDARYLVSWGGNSVGLTPGSLDVLRAKLMQFVHGGIYRKPNAAIPSPLELSGPPFFSKEAWESAARGQATEQVRSQILAGERKQVWTGLEHGVPPAL